MCNPKVNKQKIQIVVLKVANKQTKTIETEEYLSGLDRFNPRLTLILNFLSWDEVFNIYITSTVSKLDFRNNKGN